MNIVFLDRATLGFDFSLEALENKYSLTSFDTTAPEQTGKRIENAEIVITNKVKITEKDLFQAQNLKLICVAATGYNNIDIQASRKRKIPVANVKAYSTDSVAQTVFGYLLRYFNSLNEVGDEIKAGNWQKSETFNLLKYPFSNLAGKKIGIIGYGKIGQKVAEISKAFSMEIAACESFITKNKQKNRVPFDEIISKSDIITIHTPLSERTRNLISKNEFNKMKSTAVLINTARGGIVNEQDLYEALKSGKIAFAGLDVLTQEPPTDGNILFDAPNCMITPHIAWASLESRNKLIDGIIENIELFIEGKSDEIDISKQ